MNETLIKQLRTQKAGRELARNYLIDLVERSDRLLRSLGLAERICLMTFGSAGSRFLIGHSDTDFSVIDDGTVSDEEISGLQRALYREFGDAPWCVSFKCWERLRVNPMDVISLCYLCGNEKLFEEQVLASPEIADVISTKNLATLLVGNDLHIEFMSSRHFSRLLNKYHPKWELPVPISPGDVKYYSGGLRSIQYIYMTSMLLRDKRYLSDVTREDLLAARFLTSAEVETVEKALDFMLSAKDLCVEGNHIFYGPNLEALCECWKQRPEEIRAEYETHAGAVVAMCEKACQALVRAFPHHAGTAARTEADVSKLEQIIRSGSLELWRTLALRRELPNRTRALLTEEVMRRQKSHPHTMLDELVVMLEFSGNAQESEIDPESETLDLWFTDNVFRCFTRILGEDTDDPVLIRSAVHTCFLEMYLSGRVPDQTSFCDAFLDRVRKYFHCHTLCPDRETETAEKACKQIMSSGLFVRGSLTLMEIHPTNNCNLDCQWCTYRERDRAASLSLAEIRKAAALRPAEVLIAGGGEPTLFRDGPCDFSDVIRCLREELPGTRLRLITNGTFIPKGEWADEVDEISISVDDSTAGDFISHKGRDLFGRVWGNIEEYLRRRTPTFIRVTKIYNSENVLDSIALSRKLYQIWTEMPDGAKKRHFKFMVFPMADDTAQGTAYACSVLNDDTAKRWRDALTGISVSDPGMYQFLREHTNLLTVADGVPSEEPGEYCSNLAHYALLGADGMLYPCFAACSSFGSVNLGPVDQDAESLYARRCELFYRKPLGCRAGCRPGNVFYGKLSLEYYRAQRRLGLPFLEEPPHKEPMVVHVSYQDPDHIMGGQGWAVSNLCKEQVRQGLLVYWISPCVKDEKPGEYLYEGGRLRVIKLRFTDQHVETLFSDDYDNHLLREAFGRAAEDEIVRQFRPDECVMHLHGFIEVPSHSERLRTLGYRVLSTFHMLLSTRRQHILSSGSDLSYMKEAERKAIAANAFISVPTEGMVEELSADCPDYRGTFVCIPNGIGDEHFDVPKAAPDKFRDTVISFGRISPEKGFDLLIEAAKMYYDRREAASDRVVDFLVFGNTDMSVQARRLYAEKLTGMATGYAGIRVQASATGLVGADKISAIDKAVFGVIPSLYEPFGLVIPELMARGKPVIATRTAGACDIMETRAIGRNDYGFIVEQDPEAIYEAVAWLLDHPEEREAMGRNALARSRDFRWSLIAAQFNGTYEKIRSSQG